MYNIKREKVYKYLKEKVYKSYRGKRGEEEKG